MHAHLRTFLTPALDGVVTFTPWSPYPPSYPIHTGVLLPQCASELKMTTLQIRFRHNAVKNLCSCRLSNFCFPVFRFKVQSTYWVI